MPKENDKFKPALMLSAYFVDADNGEIEFLHHTVASRASDDPLRLDIVRNEKVVCFFYSTMEVEFDGRIKLAVSTRSPTYFIGDMYDDEGVQNLIDSEENEQKKQKLLLAREIMKQNHTGYLIVSPSEMYSYPQPGDFLVDKKTGEIIVGIQPNKGAGFSGPCRPSSSAPKEGVIVYFEDLKRRKTGIPCDPA